MNLQAKLRAKNDELVSSPEKFQAYQNEKLRDYNTWFYNEQFDEVTKAAMAIEDIHEWGVPKEIKDVTDEGKKKEILAWNEAHKDEYQKNNDEFKRWVDRLAGQQDKDEPNTSMPRWHGRAAIEIMKGLRARQKLEGALLEIADLKAKLAKHEAEANKRARVQSIPARPASSGTVKSGKPQAKKLGQNVRDAFDDYEW
jgi:hypothetical protein